jgi:hypothetical protein
MALDSRKSRCFPRRDSRPEGPHGRRYPQDKSLQRGGDAAEPSASFRRGWGWQRGRGWHLCCPRERNRFRNMEQRSQVPICASGANRLKWPGRSLVRWTKAQRNPEPFNSARIAAPVEVHARNTDARIIAPRDQSREEIQMSIGTASGGRIQDTFGFLRISRFRRHDLPEPSQFKATHCVTPRRRRWPQSPAWSHVDPRHR